VVRTELAAATAGLGDLERTERPLRITATLVQETIDEVTGILEHAPLETRVAWVRHLFAQIDIDSREGRAVAAWKAVTRSGCQPIGFGKRWLRRAGAGRVLNRRGPAASKIPLLHPRRSL
jgi:hypothetical protein